LKDVIKDQISDLRLCRWSLILEPGFAGYSENHVQRKVNMNANRLVFCLSVGVMISMIPIFACAENGGLEDKQRIDVNCAAVEHLCSIPGVDHDLATNIVKYRNEKGGFKSKQDLKLVPGITPEFLEKISPWLKEIPSNACTVPDSPAANHDWEEKPVLGIPNC
jgi:competence ComEA-like helix-hairpin-helix protein